MKKRQLPRKQKGNKKKTKKSKEMNQKRLQLLFKKRVIEMIV